MVVVSSSEKLPENKINQRDIHIEIVIFTYDSKTRVIDKVDGTKFRTIMIEIDHQVL